MSSFLSYCILGREICIQSNICILFSQHYCININAGTGAPSHHKTIYIVVYPLTSAVFDSSLKSALRCTFIDLKHDRSVHLAPFYHSPYRASYLDFFITRSANNSTREEYAPFFRSLALVLSFKAWVMCSNYLSIAQLTLILINQLLWSHNLFVSFSTLNVSVQHLSNGVSIVWKGYRPILTFHRCY